MANRTISLSPIGDLIRKRLVEDTGIAFSVWVEKQLIDWNAARSEETEPETPSKPKVPWYYECQLCKQKGHHASDCSMYNPIIETEGESNA